MIQSFPSRWAYLLLLAQVLVFPIGSATSAYAYGDDLQQITPRGLQNPPVVATVTVTSIQSTSAVVTGVVESQGGSVISLRGVCFVSTKTGTEQCVNHSQNGVGSFSITLTGLLPSTPYSVRAFATNTYGTAYGSTLTFSTLATSTIPPTVTTSQVTQLSQTSAVVGGNVTSQGTSSVTSRGVCLRRSSLPQQNETCTAALTAGTGSFSLTLSSLSAQTSYIIRAYAESEAGRSYGDELTFSTLAPPAEGAYTLALNFQSAQSVTQSLYVGKHPDATLNFDSNFDQYAPPAPPSGSFDARLTRSNDDLLKDIIPTTVQSAVWTISFAAGTNGLPLEISWDSSVLPAVGNFTLQDAINGSFVNVNLRSASSVTITQAISFVTSLRLVFDLDVNVNQSYQSGWNMVGLPVTTSNAGYRQLFANSLNQTLFRYAGSYALAEQLTPGTGYWLRFSASESASLRGRPINQLSVSLQQGWNMISGPSQAVTVAGIVDPSNVIIPNTWFGFANSYSLTTTLQPGRAYWVRASAAGTITMGTGSTSPSVREDLPLANASHIEFIASGSVLTRLFMDTREEVFLPPVPPVGAFDVRFSDDRAFTNATVEEIYVQQFREPVGMRIVLREDLRSVQHEVTQFQGSRILSKSIVTHGEMLNLLSGTDVVEVSRIEHANERIEHFAISDVFPSPTHHFSTIRIALPEAAPVKVQVYSALGQVVATVLEGSLPSGIHTAVLDVSNLSSGIYFVRLEANQQVITRPLSVVR